MASDVDGQNQMRRALARQGFPSEENLHLRARGLVPQTEGRTGHFSEAVDAQVLAPPGSRRPASAHAPENVRHEVEDITEYFYLAVKSGIEDVLWCGWNAEQWSHGNAKRKRSPCACSPRHGRSERRRVVASTRQMAVHAAGATNAS